MSLCVGGGGQTVAANEELTVRAQYWGNAHGTDSNPSFPDAGVLDCCDVCGSVYVNVLSGGAAMRGCCVHRTTALACMIESIDFAHAAVACDSA